MQRAAAILALGLVALLLLGPVVFAGRAQTAYESLAEQAGARVARLGPWRASLEPQAYERGLWRSVARTAVELRADAAAEPVRLHARHTIHHGPLPVTALLSGPFPRGLALAVIDTEVRAERLPPGLELEAGAGPLLRVRTEAYAGGGGRVRVSSPALRRVEGAATLEAAAARAELRFERELAHAEGRLQTDSLAVRDADTELRVAGLTLWVESRDPRETLPAGSIRLDAARVFAETGAQDPTRVTLEGVEIVQRIERDPDLAHLKLEAAFETLRVEGAHGARGYGRGHLVAQLSNLDAEAARGLAALARATGAGEAERGLWVLAGVVLLPRLLAARPALEVALDLGTGPGALEARAQVRTGERTGLALFDLAELARRLEVDLELVAARSLVASALDDLLDAEGVPAGRVPAERSAWIDCLRARGLLVPVGDRLELALVLREGQVLVNGRPYRPAETSGCTPAAVSRR